MLVMEKVLITGGSSGIGYELARTFSKNGYEVILNGSNKDRLFAAKEKLEKEYGRTVWAFDQDLSQPGGAKALYDKVAQSELQVDILINNAGMGFMDPSEKIDFEGDEAMMRLNTIALVQLCKLYLPQMYQRKRGKILNVSSMGAFQPGPYNSTYFASKSFVLSYSRAIRFEAKDRGVQVCTLCPSTTKTKFFEREGMAVPPGAVEPEFVAEFAYQKLTQNKEIIIPGLMNRLTLMMPVSLRIKLSAMMYRLR